MQAYSKDLRLRVIDAVDRGVPRTTVAEQFQVSLRTIKRWLQRRRELGSLATSPRPGPPARKLGPLRVGLLPQLQAQPDATLAEHCARWEERPGVRVSPATMSRVIRNDLGWTRKKRPGAPSSSGSRSAWPGGSACAGSIRRAGYGSTSSAATLG